MGDAIRRKAIIAQFQNATRDSDPCIQYAMDLDNINVWYIRIKNIDGNDDEYKNGEYLFRLLIPQGEGKKCLLKPPRFVSLTPNGLYEVNGVCCISIGEFHSDAKPMSLGIGDFALQLMSGLIGWKEMTSGIRIMKTSKTEKKDMAHNSKGYNDEHYAGINKLIDRFYSLYSRKFDHPRKNPLMTYIKSAAPIRNPPNSYDTKGHDAAKEENFTGFKEDCYESIIEPELKKLDAKPEVKPGEEEEEEE